MAIPFPDNISVGVGNPLDSRYLSNLNTPYIDVSAVTTAIVESQRYVGLTVNVDNEEYWFKDGITDPDLIVKSSGGVSNLTGATNGLSLFSSGATVGLGGTLSDNTTIDGAYTLSLTGDTKLSTHTGYQMSGTTILRIIGGALGCGNLGVGYNALLVNAAGKCNTSVGTYNLQANTTGCRNTAIGYAVLTQKVDGCNNIGIGTGVLSGIGNSDGNIGMGCSALGTNTTGSYNVAIGIGAIGTNQTGACNTAIGSSTLTGNQTGSRNVAIGYGAGGDGSDKLYIANCADCSLISGDFTGKTVTIDNKLITCNIQVTSGASDGYYLKSDSGGTASWSAVDVGVTTAVNGVCVDGDNFVLGGVLTGNTTICGAHTLSLGNAASGLTSLYGISNDVCFGDEGGNTYMNLINNDVDSNFSMEINSTDNWDTYAGLIIQTCRPDIEKNYVNMWLTTTGNSNASFNINTACGLSTGNYEMKVAGEDSGYRHKARIRKGVSESMYFCEGIYGDGNLVTSDSIEFIGNYSDKSFAFNCDNTTILSVLSGGTARYGIATTAAAITNDADLTNKIYVDEAVTGGSNTVNVCNVTSNYIATTTDDFIGVSGATSVSLPPSPKACQRITVVDIAGDALSAPITVVGNGLCINGDDNATINTEYGSITFINNGIFWSAVAFIN
jgi:hypothetical protein